MGTVHSSLCHTEADLSFSLLHDNNIVSISYGKVDSGRSMRNIIREKKLKRRRTEPRHSLCECTQETAEINQPFF